MSASLGMPTFNVDADRRRHLGRRAQLLAGASVTWNVIEAVIAIAAGVVAGSIALIGFGLDSIVEVSSGLIILWQFRHPLPESREKTALRLMAVSFFALAAYVSFESVRESEHTELVTDGLFAVVRNPFFAATLLTGAGIALVVPNVVALLGWTLLLAVVELQVRVVEEPYLRRHHGEAYRAYLASVGRFVPRVGLSARQPETVAALERR